MRILKDFFVRPEEEQRWLIKNTWCDSCDIADLGMIDPVEYEEDSKIVIEGKCSKCGAKVTSMISYKHA